MSPRDRFWNPHQIKVDDKEVNPPINTTERTNVFGTLYTKSRSDPTIDREYGKPDGVGAGGLPFAEAPAVGLPDLTGPLFARFSVRQFDDQIPSGTIISTWNDLSGFAHHATRTSVITGPRYRVATVNGRPRGVLDFATIDGVERQMLFTFGPGVGAGVVVQPLTYFAVAYVGDSTGTNRFIHEYFGVPRSFLATKIGAPGNINAYAGAEVLGQAAANGLHIWEAELNGASSSVTLDGVLGATGNGGANNPDGTTQPWRIGISGGGTSMEGFLCELIFCQGSLLSQAQKNQIRQSFGLYYNISYKLG